MLVETENLVSADRFRSDFDNSSRQLSKAMVPWLSRVIRK